MTFLKEIYYGLLAFCLITLLFKYKRTDKAHFWFIPLLFLSIITQVTGDILEYAGYTHFFVFHVYQPMEFLFLSIYYYYLFKPLVLKRLILISIPLFLAFHIFYYRTRFYNLDFTDFTIEAILIFVWCMMYFIRLLKSEEQIILSKDADFWINTANILFYTGCVLVMGIAKYFLSKNMTLRSQLFLINHLLNLLLYILYCIAFLCLNHSKKYNLS